MLETRNVPLNFTAVLTNTSPLSLLDVPGIWEKYVLARLQAAFRRDASAFVQSVYLSLQEEENNLGNNATTASPTQSLLRRYTTRKLQRSSTTSNATFGDEQVTLRAMGGAVFQVDKTQKDAFDTHVQDELSQILTKESLQQALLLGNNPAQVESVQYTDPSSSTASLHRPTTVELVVGFALLAVTLAALAFTLHLVWSKWRRHRRKQKQLEERQRNSVVATTKPGVPATAPAMSLPLPHGGSRTSNASSLGKSSSPRRLVTLPTTGADSEDSEDYYARRGLTVLSSGGGEPTIGDHAEDRDDDDDESEFGWELRQAAHLDLAAWEEYQRRQQELRDEAKQLARMPPPIVSLTLSPDDDRGSAVEEGMEVDERGAPIFSAALLRVQSFPYGDEKESELLDDRLQDRETVTVSAAAARAAASAALAYATADESRLRDMELGGGASGVEWTESGPVARAMALPSSSSRLLPEIDEEEEADFEPYGEHKTLQESWDRDELPAGKPSAFSFLYPFQRQHVSDSTRSSADTQSTAVAVMRGSPTTSSWSTGAAIMGGDGRDSLGQRRDLYERGDDDDDDDDEDGAAATAQMLREVAQINAYVQRYEQRKQQKRHSTTAQDRHTDAILQDLGSSSFLNASGATHASTADDSKSQSVPYEAMDDSASARKSPLVENRESVKQALARQRQLPSALTGRPRVAVIDDDVGDPALEELESPTGSGDGEEDDDESQRLGIRRYAVQKPPAPLLSYSPSRPEAQRESRIPRFVPPSNPSRTGPPTMPPQRNLHPPPPSGLPQPRTVAGLSGLRRGRAVLDDSTSDVGGVAPSESPAPFDEAAEGDPAAKPKSFRASPRAARNLQHNTPEFNDILTMFESKPSNTLVPPTIHVCTV